VTSVHYTALPLATLALTAHTRPGPRSPESPSNRADRRSDPNPTRTGTDDSR
jgi:hypothetical protein